MDYEFTVKGTVDTDDEEEVVLTEACELVAELEGVSSATFTSPNFMGVDMLEDQEAPAPAEPAPEEEPSEAEPQEAPAEEAPDETEDGEE